MCRVFRSELGTASIMNAGGVADIRSPRRLQTTGSDHETRRAPAGATEWSSRDFRSPGRGSDSIFTTNRWFAPPANIQCPFETTDTWAAPGCGPKTKDPAHSLRISGYRTAPDRACD